MEVNITFMVQIAHFIIAYYLLKIFLLKPLVKEVQKQDAILHELQQAVDARKLLVKQQEQAMHEHWVRYQQQFCAVIPEIPSSISRIPLTTVEPQFTDELPEREYRQALDSLKKDIVAKIEGRS